MRRCAPWSEPTAVLRAVITARAMDRAAQIERTVLALLQVRSSAFCHRHALQLALRAQPNMAHRSYVSCGIARGTQHATWRPCSTRTSSSCIARSWTRRSCTSFLTWRRLTCASCCRATGPLRKRATTSAAATVAGWWLVLSAAAVPFAQPTATSDVCTAGLPTYLPVYAAVSMTVLLVAAALIARA